MSKKIAEITDNVVTTNLSLASILCKMESARLNGVTNAKMSLYADSLNYNVSADFENGVYNVEILNTKTGEDYVNEQYQIPFGFQVTITSDGDLSV